MQENYDAGIVVGLIILSVVIGFIVLAKLDREEEEKKEEENSPARSEPKQEPTIVEIAWAKMTSIQKMCMFYSVLGIILLLIAMLADKLPYGYFQFLRIFITGICVRYICSKLHPAVTWFLIIFAILYNPICPIRLGDKDIWQLINAATVLLIGISETMLIMRQYKNGTSENR